MQVDCMPSGKIQVVVTEYTMDNSTISLHFTGVALAAGSSLQAVQIGHSDGVSGGPRSFLQEPCVQAKLDLTSQFAQHFSLLIVNLTDHICNSVTAL